MKIIPVAQNSLEWLTTRAGIPTASEWDALISPKFEIRTGEMPKTYLARKVAEAWLGGPLPGWNSIDMDLGKILEEEAKPFYTLNYEQQITNVGFITSDDGRIGCSPDGLIGDDGGLEIKSPEAHTHVRYLLANELPKEYVAQVHGSLYVTGRQWWRFMSYRRRFPPLMLQVNRDEEIMAVFKEALEEFLERFDNAIARIEELNDGPPQRNMTPTIQRRAEDMNEVPIPNHAAPVFTISG